MPNSIEGTKSDPPSRMGRPRHDAPSRRDAILDAALELFIERGLGATGMGDIANRASASKRTLYRLFPDTDALFTAALARKVKGRRSDIAKALDNPNLEHALFDAAHAVLRALDDHAVELFRLVIAEAGRRPDLAQSFYEELVASAVQPIGERLQRSTNMSTRDAEVLALQFVGAIKEPLFYPRLMGVIPDVASDKLVRQALVIVLNALPLCTP